MRKAALFAAAASALALSLSACGDATDTAATTGMTSIEASSGPVTTTADQMTDAAEETGTFGGLNDKNVTGTATIDAGMVSLQDFASDEGPDLHLYLTNGTDEEAVAAGVELGDIVFDQASQTFELPTSVRVGDYTDLVVHCDKAKAVFGAAALS